MRGPRKDFVWAVKTEGHLVTRRAGGSAREQANQLRDAEPVRTRLARLLKVHTDERAYRVGAVGEETVGARLAKLDPARWLVLHDIILNDKGTNLDHPVVGAAGAFSLNTKHHPKAKIVVTEKTLRVNGYAENYLHVARHEAAKVADLLSSSAGKPVEVTPTIVVMGAELEIRSQPPDVIVIRRKDLPKWFLNRPVTLQESEAKELRRIAGRPSTWKPKPTAAEPALSVTRWSGYGKTRLYVNDSDGNTLGYRDEATGQIHVNDPGDHERVKQVLTSV